MILQRAPTTLDQQVADAVAAWRAAPDGDPRRKRLREEAICVAAPLARLAAIKFQHRGEELDDLIQVALVGLINAVDRFDPARGSPFTSYAMPTMLGEVKRHFRDRGWTIRVHRHLQELHLRIGRAIPFLSQKLQRMPTVPDLAGHLGVAASEVRRGLHCAGAYRARSLDCQAPVGRTAIPLADQIGALDPQLELVPDRCTLATALAELPERERSILRLRFVDNLTQSEIAAKVGVSQMHVSRLLTRACAKLRSALD